MKRIFIIILLLTFQNGFSQKKNFFTFQIGAVRSIPQSDFLETNKVELNSGKVAPTFSVLYSLQTNNTNWYFVTGFECNYKNARIQQNIDTLTYYGIIYTQPKYRVISVPFLVSFRKSIDFNIKRVKETRRMIELSTGFCFDFVKEVRIKNGMTIIGKGFNIRTSYKNNFAFKSTTGISFNTALSFPVMQFKNKRSLNLNCSYKYPFYTQNKLKLNYTINDGVKSFEINNLRLQEITLGLRYSFL